MWGNNAFSGEGSTIEEAIRDLLKNVSGLPFYYSEIEDRCMLKETIIEIPDGLYL